MDTSLSSREYSRIKTSQHTKSVWCQSCKGAGKQRRRSAGVIPRVTIIKCRVCKGAGRVWTIPGSKYHLDSAKLIPGLWKHDKSHIRVIRK